MHIQRVPSPVSIYDNYSSNTEPNSFDIFVEQTFHEDGEIEEIFAYDNQVRAIKISTECLIQTVLDIDINEP